MRPSRNTGLHGSEPHQAQVWRLHRSPCSLCQSSPPLQVDGMPTISAACVTHMHTGAGSCCTRQTSYGRQTADGQMAVAAQGGHRVSDAAFPLHVRLQLLFAPYCATVERASSRWLLDASACSHLQSDAPSAMSLMMTTDSAIAACHKSDAHCIWSYRQHVLSKAQS